jgi:hypothetical protein
MLQHIRSFSLILACLVSLWGCSIEQDISFKKNFSGHFRYSFSFGQFLEFAKAMKDMQPPNDSLVTDSMGVNFNASPEAKLDETFRLLRDSLSKSPKTGEMFADIPGISNASFKVEEPYTIIIEADFQDLKALNALMTRLQKSGSNMETMMTPDFSKTNGGSSIEYFKLKGKKLIYEVPKPANNLNSGDMMGLDSLGSAMGEMLDYKLNFTFEQTVKKVDGKGVSVIQNGNTVNISHEMQTKEGVQVIIDLK